MLTPRDASSKIQTMGNSTGLKYPNFFNKSIAKEKKGRWGNYPLKETSEAYQLVSKQCGDLVGMEIQTNSKKKKKKFETEKLK